MGLRSWYKREVLHHGKDPVMDQARAEGEVLSGINYYVDRYHDWLLRQGVWDGDATHLANQKYVNLVAEAGLSTKGLYPQGEGVDLTEEQALRRARGERSQ